MKRRIKRFFIILILAAVLLATAVFVPNFIVIKKTESNIVTLEEAAELSDVDCAVILGAGVEDEA